MADSGAKRESRTLYSNASVSDCPSFSNLRQSVLATHSSTSRFQPKVDGAKLELQAEYANPSISISPLASAASFLPHSEPGIPTSGLILDHQNADCNACLSHIVKETPASDGYSWRKYGQKQVKNSNSSRSYYKCAHSDCHAKKKVQRCDHHSHIIDIVYIGDHNHDLSQNKCNVSRVSAASSKLAAGRRFVDSIQKVDGADMSICQEDPKQASVHIAESEQSSSSSYGDIRIKVEEHNGNGMDSKRLSVYSALLLEANKEIKLVVHATADRGISTDGYRWRKYGQKMVKGNSHLRSYYRCTSTGCPARKHVERATDNAATATITYEGKHDHDMPVLKKQKGPESLGRISSAATLNGADCKKTKSLSSQRISAEWSGDLMDEKVLELGGEKALESARTLLSIGIELEHC
uniref:WRKY transcription factor 41 n=1 Tax=Manihot esculenta TaxID=3983 RepID=A0A140H8P5_MANES|nr:WRKY transcription factor 41 [Manihot esculenta]